MDKAGVWHHITHQQFLCLGCEETPRMNIWADQQLQVGVSGDEMHELEQRLVVPYSCPAGAFVDAGALSSQDQMT